MDEIIQICNKNNYDFVEMCRQNSKQYVSYNCKNHGNQRTRIDSFRKGSICKYCFYDKLSKNKLWTTDIFKTKVLEAVGEEYRVESEYVNANTKIKLLHLTCNKTFSTTPGHFIDGTRCSFCSNRGHTKEDFKRLLHTLESINYTLIGEFCNYTTKVCLKHTSCGTTYEVKPVKFKGGQRCPTCSTAKKSHLSREINRVLQKYNILYTTEYTFKDCKNTNPLPFDFVLFNSEGSISLLVEADGIQHFKQSHLFNRKTTLEHRQKNDEIKNKYCDDKKIRLLRIPYLQIGDVEKLLTEYLHLELSKEYFCLEDSDEYKSTESRCREVRKIYASNKASIKDLESMFNVSSSVIESILHYKQLPMLLPEVRLEIKNIMESRSRKTLTNRQRKGK